MEICSRLQQIQDREHNNPNPNPSSSSPMNSPSPRSNVSINNNNNCMSSSNSNSIQIPNSPHTPKTIPRSDSNNPYPTTFVQADTTTFKHVVQMLTGSSETTTTTKPPPPPPSQDPFPPSSSSSRNFNIPPIKTAPIKKQGFKLYERRNSLKNNLILNTMMPNFSSAAFSPRKMAAPEILSPSLLDFPSLTLSPVTPLNDDAFDKSSSSPSLGNSSSEEDKAIAEKGFYLHPSPISTPRDSEPQLLPLFPLSSPRVSGSATT